jgi:hypothetical protein
MTTLFHKEFALIGTKLDKPAIRRVIDPLKGKLTQIMRRLADIYAQINKSVADEYHIKDEIINGDVGLEILLHFFFLHLYNVINILTKLQSEIAKEDSEENELALGTLELMLKQFSRVVSYGANKTPVIEQAFSRFLFTFQHDLQIEDFDGNPELGTINTKLDGITKALNYVSNNLKNEDLQLVIHRIFGKPSSPLLQSPGELPISLPSTSQPPQVTGFTNNNQGGFVPTDAEDLEADLPPPKTGKPTEVPPMFAAIPVGPASSSSSVILLDDDDEEERKRVEKEEKERKRAQKKAKKVEELAKQRAELDAQFARRQAELDAQFAARQEEVLKQTTALLNQVQASSSSSTVPQYSNLNARPKHNPEKALWYASLSPEDRIKEDKRRAEKKKRHEAKKKQVTKSTPPPVDIDAEKRAKRAEYMRNRRAMGKAAQNQPSSSSAPLTDDVETTSSSSSESTKKSKGKRGSELSPILPGDIEFKANFKLSDGYVENMIEFSKYALIICLYEESDTVYTEKVLTEYFENFLKDYKNTTAEKQVRTESKIGFIISDIDPNLQDTVKTNARTLISVFLQSLIVLLEKNETAHSKLVTALKNAQGEPGKIPNWIPSEYFVSTKRRPQIRQAVFPLIVLKAAMNLIAYIGLDIDEGILPVAPIGAVKTKAINLVYQRIFKEWIQERWVKSLQVDGANALRDIANVTLFAENPRDMFVFENLVELPMPKSTPQPSSSASSSSETSKTKTTKFTKQDIEFFNKVSPEPLTTDDEREAFLVKIIDDALFIIFNLSVDKITLLELTVKEQKQHRKAVKDALLANKNDNSSVAEFCKEIIRESTENLFIHLKTNVSAFLDEYQILNGMQSEVSIPTVGGSTIDVTERKNQFVTTVHDKYNKDNSLYVAKTYSGKHIKAASVAICFVKLAIDFYYGNVVLPYLSNIDTYDKESHKLQSEKKSFKNVPLENILPEEILDNSASKEFITFVGVYFNIPALVNHTPGTDSYQLPASSSSDVQASESDDSQEDASQRQSGTDESDEEASEVEDSDTYVSASDVESTSSSSEELITTPPKQSNTPLRVQPKRKTVVDDDDDELGAFLQADNPGNVRGKLSRK